MLSSSLDIIDIIDICYQSLDSIDIIDICYHQVLILLILLI